MTTIEEAGGFGRYQALLFLMLTLANNGPGFIVYGSTFHQLDPPYLCTYMSPDGGTYVESCSRETVCGSQDVLSYTIDQDSKFFVDNYIVRMNLTCTPKVYIGFLGAFSFAGAALACLLLPRLSDKYGRLIVLRTTIYCTLPLFLILNLAESLGAIYFVNFFLGIALIGRNFSGFVLLTESLPKHRQALIGGLLGVGDVSATLYVTFLVRYVTANM